MIKQIVEVAHPSYISLKDRHITVNRGNCCVGRVPVEDLGVLLLSNPANTISQQALSACQANGVVVAVCDEHYLPSALLLPLTGSSLHAETLREQIAASRKTKASIWHQIITAKVEAQAGLLKARSLPADHLQAMTTRLRPDNATKLEAQAAAHYWRVLYGGEFRRNPALPGVNRLLNYGYSIVRSAVARAIVGTGLHPALGLCHHNRYDNFALADDLMEPLRPAVDARALDHIEMETDTLLPDAKRLMLEILSGAVMVAGQRLPLWVGLQRYAASVKRMLKGEVDTIEVPTWQFLADTGRCG